MAFLPYKPSNCAILSGEVYFAGVSSTSASLILRPMMSCAVGAAMKSDESVPPTTPSIMAKANERMLSPPKMKMANSTMRV